MIVVDRPKLKFLLAGRVITVDVSREYKKGRVYSVGVSATKKAICRVQVLERQPIEGGWTLVVRQDASEKPRFLAANPGGLRSDYTSDFHRAAKDEPEPVDDASLRRMVEAARERDDLQRREAAHQRRIENR